MRFSNKIILTTVFWIVLSILGAFQLSAFFPGFPAFLLLMVAMSALSAISIFLLTKSHTKSIQQLERSIQNMAGGKPENLPVQPADAELEALIKSVNRFAKELAVLLEQKKQREFDLREKLQISQDKMIKLTDNLERMVAKRTAELREKDKQLLQSGKLAGLGQLSTGIAHEINQPLNIIKLIVTGMLRQHSKHKNLKMDDVVKELKLINQQTVRVQKIIEHMKAFARKRKIISVSKIDINRPINESLLLIGQQLKEHNIEFRLELEENLPFVLADPIQIEQVIINLINNARDAVEMKESELIKKGRTDFKKRITIRSYVAENKVCIQTVDNGLGMNAAVQENVFNPFYSTKDTKGTGLGLSISYNLIKNMNGEITLKSDEGKGTEFIISLPVSEKQ